MSPLERLNEAAKVLRERAQPATGADHRWGSVRSPRRGVGLVFVGAVRIATTDETLSGDASNAAYIATMHPGVGLALADWLAQIAETQESDPHDYCAGEGHGGLPCGSWWCDNVDRALAVADAILGGQS